MEAELSVMVATSEVLQERTVTDKELQNSLFWGAWRFNKHIPLVKSISSSLCLVMLRNSTAPKSSLLSVFFIHSSLFISARPGGHPCEDGLQADCKLAGL